jgi:hypothetical protein
MLRRLWEFQKRLSKRIGTFQARVMLTIFYAVLVLPFGMAVRFLADPLRIKRRPPKWLDHHPELNDIAWAKRQY